MFRLTVLASRTDLQPRTGFHVAWVDSILECSLIALCAMLYYSFNGFVLFSGIVDSLSVALAIPGNRCSTQRRKREDASGERISGVWRSKKAAITETSSSPWLW